VIGVLIDLSGPNTGTLAFSVNENRLPIAFTNLNLSGLFSPAALLKYKGSAIRANFGDRGEPFKHCPADYMPITYVK
jgi:hypothetical protein